jgi:hypothetical protein
MYFCYIDESGDCGAFDAAMPNKSGTPYFILAGLIVHAEKWKLSLDVLKTFRKKLAAQSYLPYDVEFHCSEMIDPHKTKEYTQISVADRWKIIEAFAEKIGGNDAFSIIASVINKNESTLPAHEYLTASITKLYQAYDHFLKERKQHGIVLFDRANLKTTHTHVRKLMGTGSIEDFIPGIQITQVIEDPIFRVSADSIFIQAADLIAYTLKEKEFPQTSRKKYNADRIFVNKLKRICYCSSLVNEGIIMT